MKYDKTDGTDPLGFAMKAWNSLYPRIYSLKRRAFCRRSAQMQPDWLFVVVAMWFLVCSRLARACDLIVGQAMQDWLVIWPLEQLGQLEIFWWNSIVFQAELACKSKWPRRKILCRILVWQFRFFFNPLSLSLSRVNPTEWCEKWETYHNFGYISAVLAVYISLL